MVKFLFYIFVIILDKLFPSNKIPALVYHKISEQSSRLAVRPDDFEKQLGYLKDNGYESLSLDSLFKILKGDVKIKNRNVILTFDDGFEDNFLEAGPLLFRNGFGAVFFIATKYIGDTSYFCTNKEDKLSPMMDADQIKKMASQGFEIANHFHSHRNLADLSDKDVEKEFITAKSILSDLGSFFVDVVCYPRNKKTYNAKKIVEKSGAKMGFGGRQGLIDQNSDIYDLPRVEVSNKDSMLKFRAKLSPYYHLIRNFFK